MSTPGASVPWEPPHRPWCNSAACECLPPGSGTSQVTGLHRSVSLQAALPTGPRLPACPLLGESSHRQPWFSVLPVVHLPLSAHCLLSLLSADIHILYCNPAASIKLFFIVFPGPVCAVAGSEEGQTRVRTLPVTGALGPVYPCLCHAITFHGWSHFPRIEHSVPLQHPQHMTHFLSFSGKRPPFPFDKALYGFSLADPDRQYPCPCDLGP